MLFLAVLFTAVNAQTVVFTDDFNRATLSPGGTPSTSYSNTLASNISAVTTNSYLSIGSGGTGPANGISFASGSTSVFASPYNSILSTNSGTVTWTFNFRWNRASSNNPAIPASGAYGSAIVLAGTSNVLTSGNGYAIVYGSSGTPDPIRLVSYTGGINGTLSNICSSGASDIANTNNYVSVRVTYDPATNSWSLFIRDDGASAWADPGSGVNSQKGTTTSNSTHTALSLTNFGFLWSHATGANLSSDFDNFKVSVTPKTPTTSLLNPNNTTSGGSAFTLTVTGTNFINGLSTVRWNNSNRTTTFVSATQLTANITAADILSAGTATVDVLTTGALAASNTQTFLITTAAAPTKFVITAISPSSPIQGSGFNVTVESQDNSNVTQNVSATTFFNLTSNGNAGTIGGTVSGSIIAGSNSTVLTGVILPNAGTGVVLTATRTSGDNLASGSSSPFTVLGVATQLSFVGVPSSGITGTDINSFTVEAHRADNTVDVNYTGTITLSKASGPGILSGTTAVAAVAGVATFSAIQFDQAGVYTLSAASGTLTNSTSSSISISPSPVTWNFGTGSGLVSPSSGTPFTNLTVSNMVQGNNNGTTVITASATPSSGYAGASGSFNAQAAAKIGAINTAAGGSAYFEFILTPAANHYVTLSGMSFASRSSGTGPAAFSIRSSRDNFVSNLATGTLSTGGVWALQSPSFSSTSSTAGDAVTFRIYGHSGTGSPAINTANWKIDDVVLNISVQQCVGPIITVNSGSICAGNSFTISPTGGITYTISGGNNIVSPVANTDYTVTGSDINGCENTAVSSVTVNALPNVSVNSGPVCTGSSFTMNPTGATSYVYSSGTNVVSPTANTDYTVTGTDGNSCSNTAVSSVTVNALPSVNVSGTPTICLGSSTSLTASGASSYTWSDGATTAVNIVSPSITTTYTVTGTDINGCVNSTTSVLTVSNCPGSQLIPASCGATLNTLDQNLGFTAVSGATNYRLEITNASQPFSTVNVRGNNLTTFKMSWIPGIQYGRTYNVKVAAYVGGVWQAYGNTCTVTTPSTITTTQFNAGFCNVTLSNLNQNLNFTLVPGATNYRFEIVNAAQSFSVVNVRNNTVSYFNLSWVPGIQYGRTYDIRISAYVNNTWQPYGSMCNITTPAGIPTTQLSSNVCNSSVATRGTVFTFDAVPGATNYRLLVVNAGQPLNVTNTRNTTSTNFALSYISTTQAGVTYDIQVAAYSGGVWGAYGETCQVTALSAKDNGAVDFANSRTIDNNSITEGNTFDLNIYPNPNNGLFNVELNTISQIIITNTLGQVVLNETMETGKNNLDIQNQPAGIYFINVIQNGKQQTLKLVKE